MSSVVPHSVAAKLRLLCGVFVALVPAGCAGSAPATSSNAPSGTPRTAPVASATSVVKPVGRGPRRRHPPHSHPTASGHSGSLAYSTASNHRVQAQPAPRSCHALGSGLYSRPDPACTPGALNPAVTPATIGRTICAAGWTETVRPPESITEPEKVASMAAYGDTGSTGSYEYDHLVPLELGGATNDPHNLWPEQGASPNPKDAVEDQLRQAVCGGRLSLATAQREIATNWVALARHSSPPPPGRSSAGSPHAPGAECTLTASYSSSYHDYDVYVHSNQPNQTVTVTDAYGHSDHWHTDSSGYADVYLKSGGHTPGRRITARVGQAMCSTVL